ncbi:MAG: tRNA pseudouridine(55) synthase TruB [Clostridiales bacterium]|jgi:tRNA pseudouridine55 synthase|nr:tRNA pseudouridine(55) synthase TruB [Clostridiales bacterium]
MSDGRMHTRAVSEGNDQGRMHTRAVSGAYDQGIVNVYKPKGISSFKCVGAVKKIVNVSKAGHMGTLDPEAEGVLPVCLGRATRLNEFFMDFRKSYRAGILFGVTTDTMDIWGNVISECDTEDLSVDDVKSELKYFIGETEQVPPCFSAIKVNGTPMYKLARKGIETEIKPRKICIYSIELINSFIEGKKLNITVDITCSKGTYVRSLCHDLGQRLSTGACMNSLIRIGYGPFAIDKSVTLEKFEKDPLKFILPIDYVLGKFSYIYLEERQLDDYFNGKRIIIPDENFINTEIGIEAGVRLYCKDHFYALAKAERCEKGIILMPWKSFRGDH